MERTSQAPSVVIADLDEPGLAGWLMQDLKPRHSQAPEAAKADSLRLGDALLLGDALQSSDALLSSDALQSSDALVLPPDSLVPHAVSEAPSSEAPSAAGTGLASALLADEDLAVLPSRKRGGAGLRWRHAVVLAALLAVVGAVFWGRVAPRAGEVGDVAAATIAPMAAAPLPPPPPAEVDEPALPVEVTQKGPARSHVADVPLDPESEEAWRGRRAGDAVARFADLPSPTLSRLARDERQKARSRSAARAAASKP